MDDFFYLTKRKAQKLTVQISVSDADFFWADREPFLLVDRDWDQAPDSLDRAGNSGHFTLLKFKNLSIRSKVKSIQSLGI